MLARNFKTPANLKITDAEFEALVKVLGMLERNELHHVPIVDDFYDGEITSENLGNRFNMDNTFCLADCGTTACIAGWCDVIGHTQFAPFGNLRYELSHDLYSLFCPDGSIAWSEITTAQAALALHNYLTFGEPRWSEALAG